MKRLLILACTLLASFYALADGNPDSGPLFAARLADPDNRTVALEQYKGKPLIVNFWARWCPPCRREIPELVRFRQANKGKLEVLGVAIENEGEPLKAFARSNNIEYPLFVAAEQGLPLLRSLGNTAGGLPYTLFIDRHGKVVATRMGMIRPGELDELRATLLK